MQTVAIVDYGSGNLHSAEKAFQRMSREGAGAPVIVTSDPEAVRRAVLTGFIAWFLLDSAGSVASGNAAISVLVLLLAVGPLRRPARG